MTSGTPRSPRFRRCPKASGLALRPVDHALLLAHSRYAMLSSTQAQKLVTGISADRLRRHLYDLFHHQFLSRPDGQSVSLMAGKGSRAMVHTLGPRGFRFLSTHYGLTPRRVAEDVGHGFIAHEVEVRDALIHIQLLSELIPEIEFFLVDELRDTLPPCPHDRRVDEWRVRVHFPSGERTVLVKPDAIFALRDRRAPPERALRWAFLEYDRATMSIQKRDLAYGSSVARKFASYAAAMAEGIHRERGMTPARVLIVTTTRERVHRMVDAFQAHAAMFDLPAKLFRFTDRSLQSCTSLFDPCWVDGDGKERSIFG